MPDRFGEPAGSARSPEPPHVVLSWSGGKDSCLALESLQQEGVSIAGLLTTFTREYDRVSMHGVRRTLLERQAKALGYPLHTVWISRGAGNPEYEDRFKSALSRLAASGVTQVAFGDLFLRDVRLYRERLLEATGLRPIFPLWGRETRALARDFVRKGYRAIVTCVDPRRLTPDFSGRWIDASFVESLPTDVDPCGENGEYHSFVADGPIFQEPISFSVGETVLRDSFYFCDLLCDE